MASYASRGITFAFATAITVIPLYLSGCGQTSPSTGVASSTTSQPLREAAGAQPAQAANAEFNAAELNREFNTEQYDELSENPFLVALDQPMSTFSIDVDTAAYSNIRRMLREGRRPSPGAVRIEELVNYFSYDYPAPSDEHPFSVHTELADCPWAPEHQLLKVGLKAAPIEYESRPDCNLVFLLDVSGSMLDPHKLPLVQSALKLLLDELKPDDRVAIVVYAGAAGLVLDSTPAQNQLQILAALERLSAGGSTNGGEGIRLAYRIASENLIEQGSNRVILCTDGDFNVGTTDDSALVRLIEEQAQSNIFLTVLGFGAGNLKDSKMEKLADHGNGNYAYIDSLLEARKILVEQIGGTLVTVAKDVKIQLDFNPRHIQAYRLLGYENRLLQNQDFHDDSKDAGEMGAGHTVTSFYEIIPAKSPDPSSPQPSSEFVEPKLINTASPQTVLTVKLRYKQPAANESSQFQLRLEKPRQPFAPSADFQFASAVVAYGLLLRDSPYAGEATWDWVIATAQKNLGPDESGLRAEFVQLAKTARSIALP